MTCCPVCSNFVFEVMMTGTLSIELSCDGTFQCEHSVCGLNRDPLDRFVSHCPDA